MRLRSCQALPVHLDLNLHTSLTAYWMLPGMSGCKYFTQLQSHGIRFTRLPAARPPQSCCRPCNTKVTGVLQVFASATPKQQVFTKRWPVQQQSNMGPSTGSQCATKAAYVHQVLASAMPKQHVIPSVGKCKHQSSKCPASVGQCDTRATGVHQMLAKCNTKPMQHHRNWSSSSVGKCNSKAMGVHQMPATAKPEKQVSNKCM